MHPFIQALMRPDAFDHPVAEFSLLETHISWVVLTGPFAYKIKKPVNLGFVDFTTLALRKHFCEEEVRLNRRLAPELYLGVRPIRGPVGQPTLLGDGEPIEFAVQMRQFDQRQLLPAVVERGELRRDQVDRLAVAIADFHRTAAVAGADSPFGTPEAVRGPALANLEQLELSGDTHEGLPHLRDWTDAEFERRKTWFQQRRDDGRIRECHGDMHLGNMVLIDDVVRLFDCLEFNPGLRWIDVISEIAFLVMDFQERGRPDSALRVLNGWLEQSGDYEGLVGWRWYFVYRALVRAKVAALRSAQPGIAPPEQTSKRSELRNYLELARRWTRSGPQAVILMHGVSGSGKSHVARWIAEQCGGVRVRADVERKRLFGRWGDPAKRRLTGDMYAPETTEIVYREALAGCVPSVLEAGFLAVIDATCLRQWQREHFRKLSARLRVPCWIIDVRAAPETLRRRIAARRLTADPSDADVAVLERQLADQEPLTDEESARTLIVDTEARNWEERLKSELTQRSSAVDSRTC